MIQPDTILFDLSKLLVPNANGISIPCHDIVKGNVSKQNAVLDCNCFTQVNRFPPQTWANQGPVIAMCRKLCQHFNCNQLTAKQMVDPATKGILDQTANNRDAWTSKLTLIHREMGPFNDPKLEEQRQVFVKANAEAQKRLSEANEGRVNNVVAPPELTLELIQSAVNNPKYSLKARCMLALLFPQQNFRGVKRVTELLDTWIENSPNKPDNVNLYNVETGVWTILVDKNSKKKQTNCDRAPVKLQDSERELLKALAVQSKSGYLFERLGGGKLSRENDISAPIIGVLQDILKPHKFSDAELGPRALRHRFTNEAANLALPTMEQRRQDAIQTNKALGNSQGTRLRNYQPDPINNEGPLPKRARVEQVVDEAEHASQQVQEEAETAPQHSEQEIPLLTFLQTFIKKVTRNSDGTHSLHLNM